MARTVDGSAGDADYSTIGRGNSVYRQPEPAIIGAITCDPRSSTGSG